MSIDKVLADAHEAEERVKAQKAAEEARAIRHCEGAIAAAYEALKTRDDGFPDLDTLGLVLRAFANLRPRLNDYTHHRMRRAAAHILANASYRLDRHYTGPRSETAMPPVMPKEKLPPIPPAPASADDGDL